MLVHDGMAEVIQRRESSEDLLRYDTLPTRLASRSAGRLMSTLEVRSDLPGWFDARLLDVLLASALGFLLFSRISEQRSLWLLRGYLLLVALAWLFNRIKLLPLTAALIKALVLACSLSLAILWRKESCGV